MKNVLVTLSFLLCMSPFLKTWGQYAYNDAFKIQGSMNIDLGFSEDNAKKTLEVLRKYYPNEDLTKVLADAKENPFIGKYLNQITLVNAAEAPKRRGKDDGTRSAFNIIESATTGFSSPSTLLLGLADFLVKRTKQELNIAFFKEFQEKIDSSQELQYLFPSVATVLKTIDQDIYQFKAFWEVLRESFLTDLENTLDNLQVYLQETDKIKKEEVRMLMIDWFRVIKMFKDQSTPASVIDYLGNKAFIHYVPTEDKTFKTLQENLKILGLFSKSLEQEEEPGYWIMPEQMELLVRDTVMADFYLGLLYATGSEYKLGDKKLGEYLLDLNDINARLRFFVRCIGGFVEKGRSLVQLANSIRQNQVNKRLGNPRSTNIEDEYDDYYRFVQTTIDLADYSYAIKKELTGSTNKEDSLVNKYISVISDLNKLGLDIRKKRYTAAVLSTLFIIEKMLPPGYDCERQVLLKYGTFVATAAMAKTPEEVSKAIEAFALPPGGSAIKKYSKFSIALNAYVGLSAGQEILKDVGTKPYYAVTAPVGITFNWGFKRAGALSIMLSAFDVGALTAFRFQDNTTNELPDLKFENVLAPGGYLIYGVPKYPIAIGVGAQLGPNLRSVNDATLNIDKTSGWRWGAFLAVDIPMVSIFSSNKKYKACKRARKQEQKEKAKAAKNEKEK
ncbi:MAG: hypothetical protein GY810_30085 [Aureispira sp.]|nr:hypothetical protein [Aureispira sp.]